MNNPEQFTEFLTHCKLEKIKRLYLADLYMIVNDSSSDFGSIVIEFEDCMYLLTSKYQHCIDEEINEFRVQKIKSLTDIPHEITDGDIYMTISPKEISFVTEMVDEDGYFNGLELKMEDFYLFLFVSYPNIIATSDKVDDLKYLMYPAQFSDLDEELR